LAKYAHHLLSKQKHLDAIELYCKASHFFDAAKLLFQLAAVAGKDSSQLLRTKKLYVLGALQIEKFHAHKKGNGDTRATLQGLLAEGQTTGEVQSRLMDSAWRGAEAFHFLMLCQRQLYNNEVTNALRTAMRLTEYDDLLDAKTAYSLLALAAVTARCYAVCSKAFSKLESLSTLTDKQRQQYEDLALQIFTSAPCKKGPRDAPTGNISCNRCGGASPDWATACQVQGCETTFLCSVVTGKSMTETEFWICDVCKHRATEPELLNVKNCPLCHAAI